MKVICIGGFDPCNKAGITADSLILKEWGIQPLSVQTCITYQNHRRVFDVLWLKKDSIGKQLEALSIYPVSWAKVSVVRSVGMAAFIFKNLKSKNIKILWDPVLAASSGLQFFRTGQVGSIIKLLNLIDIITPNIPECIRIFKTVDPSELQLLVRKNFPGLTVILKSGHSRSRIIRDMIITKNSMGKVIAEKIPNTVHGTGCVYAASITSSVARSHSLAKAVAFAQERTLKYIIENEKHS